MRVTSLIVELMPQFQIGSQAATRQRQWLPSAGIALLMLPVLLWFSLEFLHITPRPQPLKITANPEAAEVNATAAAPPPPLPPPPPPMATEDWQLVRLDLKLLRKQITGRRTYCLTCKVRRVVGHSSRCVAGRRQSFFLQTPPRRSHGVVEAMRHAQAQLAG